MESINNIIEFAKNNQFILTGLGLSGAGIIGFWLKDIPNKIYQIIERECTTELVMTSQHKSFYDFVKWIGKTYPNKNFRKLKVSNYGGRYDRNEDINNSITSIGYGTHWLWYKRNLLNIQLIKEQANNTDRDKDSIRIIRLGRSRRVFDTLIREIENSYKNEKIKIYALSSGCWNYIREIERRDFNSIYIEGEKKKILTDTLSKFMASKQWYIDHGIPYQLGILLHGSPGTGKTSLIKAIASYLRYPIYYLSADKLSYITEAMSELEDNCLVVIEDIDSNETTHSREKKVSNNAYDDDITKVFKTVNLADILNALDGMFSANGRILIATTNHPEVLDSALLRPGRIDLELEVGFVVEETLYSFIKSFFPETHITMTMINSMKIKQDMTVAELQNLVMMGYNDNDILEFSKYDKLEKVV